MADLIDLIDNYPVYMEMKMHATNSRAENTIPFFPGGDGGVGSYCISDKNKIIRLLFDYDEQHYRLIEVSEMKFSAYENDADCTIVKEVTPILNGFNAIGGSISDAAKSFRSFGFELSHSSKRDFYYEKTLPVSAMKIKDDAGLPISMIKKSKIIICVSVDSNNFINRLSLSYVESFDN